MKAFLDEYNQPKIQITLEGHRREKTIEAIIDTGFNGDICLPISTAIELGLELCACQTTELADGSLKTDLVFIGRGALADQPMIDVEIVLTESEDALLGTAMLLDYKFQVDFVKRTVKIDRSTNVGTDNTESTDS